MKNKIICLSLGVLFGLVIAELLLRLAAFGYNVAYKPPQRNKNPGFNILCVGESTTFGIGTPNPPLYCYPRQLEKMLNARFPDQQVRCFYDQSIGINTTQNLIKLPSAITNYQPKLVIFMVGINNSWNLDRSNILYFNKNRNLREISVSIEVFLSRFRVYKLLKWLAYSNGLIKLDNHVDWPDESRGDKENMKIRMKMAEELYKPVARYQDIFERIAYHDLQRMIEICKKKKIGVIICSYPTDHPGLHRGQKELSLRFNCYFVDNSLAFSKLANINDYFSGDGSHPNEKGYVVIAENIYHCILEHKLLK